MITFRLLPEVSTAWRDGCTKLYTLTAFHWAWSNTVGSYRLCRVDSGFFFSSILRIYIIFFRGSWEFLGFCGTQKELWERVEDFRQTKGLACFSVVKQVVSSWNMHSICTLIFIASSQFTNSSGNTRIFICMKSLYFLSSLTTVEHWGAWTLIILTIA